MRHRVVAWLAAVLLPVAAASPARAAGACVTVAYVAQLHQSLSALREEPPDPIRARAPLVALIASGGQPILRPVLADLDAAPPHLEDAARRLTALTEVLDLPAGTGCPVDAGPAHDALRQVYASRVFANLDRAESHSLLEDAGSAVLRMFGGIAGGLSPPLFAVLVALVLGGLATGGLRWWRRLPRATVAARPAAPGRPSPDPDREWAAAAAAAIAGDHREAVRQAFRSALSSMALRGRLQVDPSWTTGQLLSASVTDVDLLAALAAAAAGFDRAWYSGEPVSASDWELARSRCQELRSLARRGRPAAAP